MRAILDVNILASASVFFERTPWRIVEAGFRGDYMLFVSDEMLVTLGIVLTRPYFAARLTTGECERFLFDVRNGSHRETPDETVRGVAPDLEDDLVLGTAVAANAEFLVTGDKGLLAIGEFQGVRIVTAARFLTEIGQA